MFGAAPTWLVLIEVVVFTVALVAFAVVFWLGRSAAWKHALDGASTRADTAIALNSIVYCACNVAIGVVTLIGRPHGLGLLTLFTICTYLYPPLIIADTLAGDPHRPALRLPALRGLHHLVWAASLTLAGFIAGLYLDLWQVRLTGAFFNLTIGALFLVAVVVALVAERHRRRTARGYVPRHEARWIMRLFAASAGLSIVLMAGAGDLRTASYGLSLTTRLLPVAFLVAGTWAHGRAAFYDLLIKRVMLTMLAMVVLGAAFAAIQPFVRALGPGLAAVLSGVLLAPLVIALLGVGRVLSEWLDTRWLGRRFSAGDAIEHLLAATRASDDRTEIERRGLCAIGELFDGSARLVPAASDAPGFGHVGRAPVDDSCAVEVTRRDESRRFYAEDLALLRSVGRVLGLEFARVVLERARQAEAARALRAQVNPHFLFNALTTIGGWMQADPARAEDIVEALSDVFRYTLRGTTSEWVPLEAEATAVRRYLGVEQARFGARLTFEVTIDEAVREAMVPPLLVLTLAENAVKHGVAASSEPVHVRARASADADGVCIEVADTAGALDTAWADRPRTEAGGFGLASVRERLRLLCGHEASLEGRRDDARGETRFTLRLPLRRMSAAS